MKTNAPVLFDIKINHSVKYEPTRIFKAIQTTRQLPKNLRQIIDSLIQRNAFFVGPKICYYQWQ